MFAGMQHVRADIAMACASHAKREQLFCDGEKRDKIHLMIAPIRWIDQTWTL